MGYAITGYFDCGAEEALRSIWRELARRDLDDYLIGSENRPHVKLAMFEELGRISFHPARRLADIRFGRGPGPA